MDSDKDYDYLTETRDSRAEWGFYVLCVIASIIGGIVFV